ncbi:hypothetical protein ABPG75_011031 [Micractinium tetrahymenae]
MGQALCATGPSAEVGLCQQVSLPLSLRGELRTTVLELGMSNDGAVASAAADDLHWHVVGGRKAFPLPPGYSATCTAYGRRCSLLIEPCSSSSKGGGSGACSTGSAGPRFVVCCEDGARYEGACPTAALAQLALALGQPAAVNGMKAFGFLSPLVQHLLRTAAAAQGLPLDEPVQQAAQHAQHAAQQQQVAGAALLQLLPANEGQPRGGGQPAVQAWVDLPPQKSARLLPHQHQQETSQQQHQQHQQHLQSHPSAFATDLTGAGRGKRGGQAPSSAAYRPPLPRSASAPAPHASAFALATSLPATAPSPFALPAQQAGAVPLALPRKHSRKPQHPQQAQQAQQQPTSLPEGPDGSDSEGEVAELLRRPSSRSRQRRVASTASGRSGAGSRGWTAFTAFGVRNRQAVREEHPKASAPEVEKLLGQRWAALPQEEKAEYQELAARVRAGGGTTTAGSAEGLAGPEHASSGASLVEERPQRTSRPNPFYEGLFVTSQDEDGSEGENGGASSDAGSVGSKRPASLRGLQRASSTSSAKRGRSQGGSGGAGVGGAAAAKHSRAKLSRAASAPMPGAAAGLVVGPDTLLDLDASLELLAQMSPAEAAVAEALAGPALPAAMAE